MKIIDRVTLNKPLLRKLAAKLRGLRHEEHYNQFVWAKKTQCGTAACIAGHTVLLAGLKLGYARYPDYPDQITSCLNGKEELEIEDAARTLLGISLWNMLFSSEPENAWPEPFATRWKRRKRTRERPSRIAADYIDAIIAGKAEA